MEVNYLGRRIGLLATLALLLAAPALLLGQSVVKTKPRGERSIAYWSKLLADMALALRDGYMEEINIDQIFTDAADGMLNNLDPYSILLTAEDYESLKESTSGKYEGIGIDIDVRDGEVTVIAPLDGTPAARLGFRPGDKIIRIDDTPTANLNNAEINRLVRGKAGSKVKLTIRRPGFEFPMDYWVERAVIEVHPVRYAGMIDGTIGYVRIAKFGEGTEREMRAAVSSLQSQGCKSLILDLRANGGGLLDQAIATANIFLPKDRLVVYTQGKSVATMRRYETPAEPLFPTGDLVVLVDSGTASASEIVAGSLQDWDRGVILGHTTYGKGLVQNVIEWPNSDHALKLTTSKYYIPSGRSIQKPERAYKNGNGNVIADKGDRKLYKTENGRKVYGGGGISPDVESASEQLNPIEFNLTRENLFFQFAVQYVADHPQTPRDFAVSDQLIEEFRRFVDSRNFRYQTNLEHLVAELEATAEAERKSAALAKDLLSLQKAIEREKQHDFDSARDYIRSTLRREILHARFGETGVYEQIITKEDPVVLQAVELIKDRSRYRSLLK